MDLISPFEPTAALPAALLEAEPLRVVAQPSIFREPTKRIVQTVPHGATVLDCLLQTGMGELRGDVVHLPGKVVIEVDGYEIDRDEWLDHRPGPGELVNIFLVPGNQRQAILIGASLAIGVAAIATGGLAATAGYPILGAIGAATIAATGSYDLTEFPGRGR